MEKLSQQLNISNKPVKFAYLATFRKRKVSDKMKTDLREAGIWQAFLEAQFCSRPASPDAHAHVMTEEIELLETAVWTPKCPNCGATERQSKNGRDDYLEKQRYKCMGCGRRYRSELITSDAGTPRVYV
eukprot:g37228.t1